MTDNIFGDIFATDSSIDHTTIGLPSDYLDYDPEKERKKYLEEAPTKQAGFLDAWLSGLFNEKKIGQALDYAGAETSLEESTTRNAILATEPGALSRTSFDEALGVGEENDFSSSKFFTYMKQLAGDSVGFMTAPITASFIGKGIGVAARLTPMGNALSALGFGVTAAAQYFGDNMERQAAANQDRINQGEEIRDPNWESAALASGFQASLDIVPFIFKPLSKLVGFEGPEAATKFASDIAEKLKLKTVPLEKSKLGDATEIITGDTVGTRALKGAITVGAMEVPQELAQAVAERSQAGLSLSDADARKEYTEAGFAALLLGAPLGASLNAISAPPPAESEGTPVDSRKQITDDPSKLGAGVAAGTTAGTTADTTTDATTDFDIDDTPLDQLVSNFVTNQGILDDLLQRKNVPTDFQERIDFLVDLNLADITPELRAKFSQNEEEVNKIFQKLYDQKLKEELIKRGEKDEETKAAEAMLKGTGKKEGTGKEEGTGKKKYFLDENNVEPLVRKIEAEQKAGRNYVPTREEQQLFINFPKTRSAVYAKLTKEDIARRAAGVVDPSSISVGIITQKIIDAAKNLKEIKGKLDFETEADYIDYLEEKSGKKIRVGTGTAWEQGQAAYNAKTAETTLYQDDPANVEPLINRMSIEGTRYDNLEARDQALLERFPNEAAEATRKIVNRQYSAIPELKDTEDMDADAYKTIDKVLEAKQLTAEEVKGALGNENETRRNEIIGLFEELEEATTKYNLTATPKTKIKQLRDADGNFVELEKSLTDVTKRKEEAAGEVVARSQLIRNKLNEYNFIIEDGKAGSEIKLKGKDGKGRPITTKLTKTENNLKQAESRLVAEIADIAQPPRSAADTEAISSAERIANERFRLSFPYGVREQTELAAQQLEAVETRLDTAAQLGRLRAATQDVTRQLQDTLLDANTTSKKLESIKNKFIESIPVNTTGDSNAKIEQVTKLYTDLIKVKRQSESLLELRNKVAKELKKINASADIDTKTRNEIALANIVKTRYETQVSGLVVTNPLAEIEAVAADKIKAEKLREERAKRAAENEAKILARELENEKVINEVIDNIETLLSPEAAEIVIDKYNGNTNGTAGADLKLSKGMQKRIKASAKQKILSIPASPKVGLAIESGNTPDVLRAVAEQVNPVLPFMSKIAKRLTSLTSTVGIRYDNSLPDHIGGRFVNGTILINPRTGNTPYVILHEAAHAATLQVLNVTPDGSTFITPPKKGSPAYLLNQIFNDVKPFLEPEMFNNANTNIGEFVAEVIANPVLQQRLKELRYFDGKIKEKTFKDTVISFWDKIIDTVKRILFPFIKTKPSKKRMSVFDEAYSSVNSILSTPISNKDMPTLYEFAVNNEVIDQTIEQYRSGVPRVQSNNWAIFVSKLPRVIKDAVLSFAPFSRGLLPAANTAFDSFLQEKGKILEEVIQQKPAREASLRKRVEPVINNIERLQKKDPEAFKELAELTIQTTEIELNPRYVENSKEKIRAYDSEGNLDETAESGKMYEKMKAKIISNADGLYNEGLEAALAEHKELQDRYNALSPEYKEAYNQMEESYKTLWNEIKQLIQPVVNRLRLQPEEKRNIIKNLQNNIINRAMIDPYFALGRFGAFRLSYTHPTKLQINKSDAGTSTEPMRGVEHFETEARRNDKINELINEYASNITDPQLRTQVFKLYDSRSRYGINVETIGESDIRDTSNNELNVAIDKIARVDGVTQQEAAAIIDELVRIQNNLTVDQKITLSKMDGIIKFQESYDASFEKNIPPDSLLRGFVKTLDDNIKVVEKEGNIESIRLVKEQKKEFLDLLIASMPEVVMAGKVRLRSKPSIQGASRDIARTFVQSTDGMINKISALQFNSKMTSTMGEIRAHIEENQGSQGDIAFPLGAEEATYYADKIAKQVEFAKNPNFSRLTNFMTATSFHWMLGLNISSGFMQFTQIPLVIIPMLLGRYGPGGGRAILKSMRYVMGTGFSRDVTDLSGKTHTVSSNPSMLNYSDKRLSQIDKEIGAPAGTVKAVLEDLRTHNHIGTSTMFDYLDISRYSTQFNKIKRAQGKLLKLSGTVFNAAEQFSREVTALSILQMEILKAKKNKKIVNGMWGGKPIAESLDKGNANRDSELGRIVRQMANGIQEMHGATALGATSQISQTNVGKVFTIFKSYGFAMYTLLFRMMANAFPRKGMTPEERAEARIARFQLSGIIGASALLAGVHGVPMFWIPELVHDILKEEGEEDFETKTRKFFGESLFDKVFGISFSSRVGWNDLVIRDGLADTSRNVYLTDRILTQLLGAPYSIATQTEKGANLMLNGHTARGIETMLPLAFRNALKSYRYASDGAKTIRGDTMVGNVSGYNVGMQLLGFSPKSVMMVAEANAQQKRIQNEIRGLESRLMNKLFLARRTYDTELFLDTYQELLELGAKDPRTNLTPKSIERRLKSRAKASTMEGGMMWGISVPKRYRASALEDFGEFDHDVNFNDLLFSGG